MTSKKMKQVIKQTVLVTVIASFLTNGVVFAHGTFNNLNDFQKDVNYHLMNRDTNFVINYTGNTDEFLKQANDYIKNAYSSDDYLRWSWTNIHPQVSGVKNNLNVTFTASYISTKEQEDYVTSRANEIVSQITNSSMTQVQKIKAIYDYVTSHVTYDYSMQKKSAYNALADGTSTCLGYAQLMDKMLEDAGVPTLIITGNITSGFHAWTLAQIDGKWYNFDATNGSVSEVTRYNYYAKSDSEMKAKNYTWDTTAFPQATQTYVESATNDYHTATFMTNLSLATSAVSSAETMKNYVYTDKAEKAIALLTDSTEKTDLVTRLNAVKKAIDDKNIASATNAVAMAEKYKKDVYIKLAQGYILLLKDGDVKTALTNRINALLPSNTSTTIPSTQTTTPATTNTAKAIQDATAKVVDAEKFQTDFFIGRAQDAVTSLLDSTEKTALQKRIQAIQDTIYQKAVDYATLQVTNAEKYKRAVYINNAIKYVNVLKDGQVKTDLMNRINTVKTAIGMQ